MLDTNTEWGKHAEQRLRSDLIGWLTTVSSSGKPFTVPVWFLWDGNSILLFSQPGKLKLRNIQQNPYVTLALDDTKGGGDVVIVEGTAEHLQDPNLKATLPEYVQKYIAKMKAMGWTAEQMASNYSEPIRITPTKIRAWG
ncbi:PPOX class probable F420-dependent enzyme [Thermosporothrix hazakensis]|jgi:PPOX class probable F420-dependent enzyme|uniref:PPOX class probable F420-dependent enzyme n=1 Tax=Thermosporothrix hazakensis TaxID=644383 RepID=A0A326U9L0_THEHA|nr:TIGR03667 family PPOX class F420-dependent oxidoreductase [Thermosporothrix hazakensis]PZW32720.1 PPOX class probable F420-dependent enzyme [Thermosporothrix hazakensis]GCE50076.1 PPOX class F420-dependent oxidoreductase [Thermosporothrix hazakensis]